MKDQLLSVAVYIESLEQRIAALEARCDSLENERKERHAAASVEEEPEVEVELIVDEDEQENEPEIGQENGQESVHEIEQVEERQVAEQKTEEADVADVADAPAEVQAAESEPEPESEPVHESDSEPEPQVSARPQPARSPQQTSLFGSPVTDIRQAISIGDRFLFQRELFGGNGEAMQKMLDRINVCGNLNEALDIIARQDWDKDTPTYELFINVLRRRFQS